METKICYRCKEDKDICEFNKRGKGYASECRDCHKLYLKDHYEKNKQYYIDKSKKNINILREKCNEYKRELVCFDCGYSFKEHPSVCDFHHTDDNKEASPARISRQSWNKFLEEISKCIPLCANCHRIRHNSSIV